MYTVLVCNYVCLYVKECTSYASLPSYEVMTHLTGEDTLIKGFGYNYILFISMVTMLPPLSVTIKQPKWS